MDNQLGSTPMYTLFLNKIVGLNFTLYIISLFVVTSKFDLT